MQYQILRIQDPPLTLFVLGLGLIFSFGFRYMNTRVKCDTYSIDSGVTAMSSINRNFGKMKMECKPGVTGGIFLPQSWTLKNRSDVKFNCGNCSILFSYVLQIEDSGMAIWLSD